MATGAVSGYKRTTEPVISHVTQNFIASAGAESGWRYNQGHVLEIRKFKNRDKFMHFIVRVIKRYIYCYCHLATNSILITKNLNFVLYEIVYF